MHPQPNPQPIIKEIKLDFKDSKYATGRRKKSIAKVWLKRGLSCFKSNQLFLIYIT